MSQSPSKKQTSYLPEVFMIKHMNGEIQKLSLLKHGIVTCEKYVSKKRFWGCYIYQNGQFKEVVDAIYNIPNDMKMMFFQRNKLAKDVKKMPGIIEKILSTVMDLKNKTFLISYSDYDFSIYDKFVKGKLLQFDLLFNQENLEIYEVPPPKNPTWLDYLDTENIDFQNSKSLTIYNHEIQFSSQIKAFNLYPRQGKAYLIHPQVSMTLTLTSPEYGENSVVLTANKYYLITHPKPSK
jgi:hypothetical protein